MQIMTLDFETYYNQDYSLKKLTTEAYIRNDLFKVLFHASTIDGDMICIDRDLTTLDWDNIALITHNAFFDVSILKWHYNIEPAYCYDTLAMARGLYGLKTKCGLAVLAKLFGIGTKGIEVVKAVDKHLCDFSPTELLAYKQYCINDVALTLRLFIVLKEKFPQLELDLINLLIKMYINPVLILDKAILNESYVDIIKTKETVLQRTGADLRKLRSDKAFSELLKKLDVIPPTKNSKTTGKVIFAFAKTDEAFIDLLSHENEQVVQLVAARLKIKSSIRETRTKRFLAVADRGALPILLRFYGAHTGRLSGGDKLNLQNLPIADPLRYAITAPEGYSLIAADLNAIELCMLLWFSKDKVRLEQLRQKIDLYCLFASTIYGRTITKADATERFVGKVCELQLMYQSGAAKLQASIKQRSKEVVQLDLTRCKSIVDLYRTTHPHIVSSWKEANNTLLSMVTNTVKKACFARPLLHVIQNKLLLPNGMYLYYPNLQYDDGSFSYTDARKPYKINIYGGKLIENITQALARILITNNMLSLNNKYRIVLQVHDELVFLVPTHAVEAACKVIKQAMTTAPAWATDLPLAVSIKVGNNYGVCK